MPMDKKRYPANWKEIALEVKAAAGWRCAGCGKKCLAGLPGIEKRDLIVEE